MTFNSIYRQGFLRVAACTPKVTIGDPAANAKAICGIALKASQEDVAVALFPELSISAYSIGDLVQQDVLLDEVELALVELAYKTAHVNTTLVVGAPIRHAGRLYNTAVILSGGGVRGVVPKTFMPNYREFEERRVFASGAGIEREEIKIGAWTVPFGTDLLFQFEGLQDATVFAEICEDFWGPKPPSSNAALAGATVLLNLSASNITIGKGEARRMLCQSQSARCIAAYVYSAAGAGESTTDLAWDGQAIVCENGDLLAEGERFLMAEQMVVADIDLDRLRQERMRTVTFGDSRELHDHEFRTVTLEGRQFRSDASEVLRRSIERFPFVPSNAARLDEDCFEAYNIQVSGLVQRMQWTRSKKIIIGVSGGLDSTQALIVAARAFDLLGWSRKDIHGFTLPGFATGSTTKGNAWALMNSLGITAEEIDIKPMAMQILKDIGHPYATGEQLFDVTFENVQAGARTDLLFRLANRRGGIVLGTGDLSEIALGWSTYGADGIAYYNPNGGVPKTLIQYLTRWVANKGVFDQAVNDTLLSILDTEISPELVPPGADGTIQSTEDLIGPYELHDFFLYYTVRRGYRPSKVAYLAYEAWKDRSAGLWPAGFPDDAKHQYDLATIKRFYRVFLERFFGFSQFKRTMVPNGPKVSSGGSLSPRGDWRAPTDGNAVIWLKDLDSVPDIVSGR